MDEKSELEKLHEPGFRGILYILYKRGTVNKLPFVLSVSFSFVLVCYLALFQTESHFLLLREASDLIVSAFPDLLGFSLGGYAIAVGFSNTSLLKFSTNTQKQNIYQSLSAIFAWSLLFQTIATIIGLAISWGIKTKLNELLFLDNLAFVTIGNFFLLFSVIFCSLYSLLLTPFIITNLFTLSQLNSLHFTIEKIQEDKAKEDEEESERQS